MNRPIIDLWTKQSLIMCGWAFNWGSERRSLLAKVMRGQEWGEFDWVLWHKGKVWDTNDHWADASESFSRPLALVFFSCFFLYLNKWHLSYFTIILLLKKEKFPFSTHFSVLFSIVPHSFSNSWILSSCMQF